MSLRQALTPFERRISVLLPVTREHPVRIFILAAYFLCAVMYLVLSRSDIALRRRIAFASGVIVLTLPLVLGGYPGIHTFAAIAVLPCFFVFLAGVARPILAERSWVRVYGTVAVILAVVSTAVQVSP